MKISEMSIIRKTLYALLALFILMQVHAIYCFHDRYSSRLKYIAAPFYSISLLELRLTGVAEQKDRLEVYDSVKKEMAYYKPMIGDELEQYIYNSVIALSPSNFYFPNKAPFESGNTVYPGYPASSYSFNDLGGHEQYFVGGVLSYRSGIFIIFDDALCRAYNPLPTNKLHFFQCDRFFKNDDGTVMISQEDEHGHLIILHANRGY